MMEFDRFISGKSTFSSLIDYDSSFEGVVAL